MLKHIAWMPAAILFIMAFAGCASQESERAEEARVDDAKEEVAEAKEALKDAREELREEKREATAADDKEELNKEAELRINKNNDQFAKLRWDLNKSDRNYEERKRRIDKLDERNRDFRRRLNEYDVNWTRQEREEFKREFRKDMDELEQAIQDAFRDNQP